MYKVQAQVTWERDADGGPLQGTRQLPTFYLNREVQGILSEWTAAKVALDIIRQSVAPLLDVCDDVYMTAHLTIDDGIHAPEGFALDVATGQAV